VALQYQDESDDDFEILGTSTDRDTYFLGMDVPMDCTDHVTFIGYVNEVPEIEYLETFPPQCDHCGCFMGYSGDMMCECDEVECPMCLLSTGGWKGSCGCSK
jgi:hypothetical protein